MSLSQIRVAKLAEMQKRASIREGLPHLHAFKWYSWAWEFFTSTNKFNFLTAANQISKSSTQIRKCIEWATNPILWEELWDHKPNQFWYFYPTSKQATGEWVTKWSQFMPRNEFKDDPIRGWKHEMKHGEIHAIHFNSGVHVYFKTYKQEESSLQTSTVDAVWLDEEIPEHLFPELLFRISSTDGYMHMVFTATLGQELWRLTMEPEEHEKENYPDAWKKTVSLYDCQFYQDGSPSHWTDEKIQMVIDRCPTHEEVLRRVFGRFILESKGRMFPTFDIKKHMKPVSKRPPPDWLIYGCVDPGGGGTSHPTGILFVAVRPDFRAARVIEAWRGDDIVTTAGDALLKFQEIRDQNKFTMTSQIFDWASKDFETVAGRVSEPFIPADKTVDKGVEIVNVLLKNNMLEICDGDTELYKLAQELSSVNKTTTKNKRKDDLVDPLRYICIAVPWDFTVIDGQVNHKEAPDAPKLTPMQIEVAERRKQFESGKNDGEQDEIQQEFDEWNEAYG